MLIGIDGNEANVEKKVGISEYVYELLLQFNKMQGGNVKFEIYLKNSPRDDLPPVGKNWHYHVFGPRKLWTQFALPLRLYINKNRPDVFFSPGHYAPRFSPLPQVISIMDLAFFHFPEYFTRKDLAQLKSWTEYSVRKADAIITISHASKDDIIKQYTIPEEKIYVVYPGIKVGMNLQHSVFVMNELKAKYSLTDKYILFVGTLQPRKNISRLIEAFSILSKKRAFSDIELVIVGKKGWSYEEILQAPKKFAVSDRVKFLDFVPDDDLPFLYQHAQCFVLPSLYEGFGLPVLEAMKYNCPVITSNVSSLPEAGGDAAVYIDPLSVSDIAEKLEKVLSDRDLRNTMIERGRKQIQKFSWEKAAKETLKILEKVYQQKV